MRDYPRDIIAAYASGAITRAQFKNHITAWQKSRGIDYNCKGYGSHGSIYLTYRGFNGIIHGSTIGFITDTYKDKRGHRRYVRDTAETVFEFCRKVDFAINAGKRGVVWN